MKNLFIPQNGCPRIIRGRQPFDEVEGFVEYSVISPNHTVLYKVGETCGQNEFFRGLGANFPGACLIMKNDDQGEECDIEDNVLELLDQILENDRQKRDEFMDFFVKQGITVINM